MKHYELIPRVRYSIRADSGLGRRRFPQETPVDVWKECAVLRVLSLDQTLDSQPGENPSKDAYIQNTFIKSWLPCCMSGVRAGREQVALWGYLYSTALTDGTVIVEAFLSWFTWEKAESFSREYGRRITCVEIPLARCTGRARPSCVASLRILLICMHRFCFSACPCISFISMWPLLFGFDVPSYQ